MKSPKVPIWHVVWHDAAHPRGAWQDLDEVEADPVETFTIGYLIFKDRTQVKLAATMTTDEQFTAEMMIPKKCIVSIDEVVDGRWKRIYPKPKK